MLTPEQLIEGQFYFRVIYFIRESNAPIIKTDIYIGKNLYSDKYEYPVDEWFFQDAESYQKAGSFLQKKKGRKYDVISVDINVLEHMYDIEGLIEALMNIKKEDH